MQHKWKPRKWQPAQGVQIRQTVCTNIIQEKLMPPVCPQCKVNRDDYAKYQVASYRGHSYIMLVSIATAMFLCPKCTLTYVTLDFKNTAAFEKCRIKRDQKRLAQLKMTYQHT